MNLKEISLVNFRNYNKINIKLNKKLNILLGNNAQGKTNILESIYVLALTKSHRVINDNDLIMFGKENTKVEGKIKNNDNILNKLKVVISKKKCEVFFNDGIVKRRSDYISKLRVILFTPDDLEIVKGSPSIRRGLLNIEISQISKKYIQYLNEYNKILKLRNEYLKLLYLNNMSDKNYLDILTNSLVEKAIFIYQYRSEFLNKVQTNLVNIFYDISLQKNIKLVYENNCDISEYTPEDIRKSMLTKYKSNYNRELIQGMTLYGPHRDDFNFYLDDKILKVYGSQGQQRMAIISFKLAELEVFKEHCGEYPVLLLDDIFSELDKNKKNKLLKYINRDIQTIITTTDLRGISKKIIGDSYIYIIENGKIRKGDNNERK